MSVKKKFFVFTLITIVLIALDQLTKQVAKAYLENTPPITMLNDMVRLLYIENTGAFLSLGDNLGKIPGLIFLTLLPLILLGFLLFELNRRKESITKAELIVFALIFAGGAGNMIDRILNDRSVIDFMNVGIGNLRTGIFNVADMYIMAGAIWMLLLYFKKKSGMPEVGEVKEGE